MIQVGIISEVREDKVRVSLSEKLVTDFLPVIQIANSFCSSWVPLRVGEQCVVLPIVGNTNSGVVLRGIFYKNFPAPSTDKNTQMTNFEDGTSISYNTKNKILNITLAGDINININGNANIKSKMVTVDAPVSKFNGVLLAESITIGGNSGAEFNYNNGRVVMNKSIECLGNVKVNGNLDVLGTLNK